MNNVMLQEFKQKLEQLCTVYGVEISTEEEVWTPGSHIAVTEVESGQVVLRFESVDYDEAKKLSHMVEVT